jgi:hypothetical protein
MKTDFYTSLLLYFAMNIHQFYSPQIVWQSLSERIKFSHFISELKISTVTLGSRNTTDENKNKTCGIRVLDSAIGLGFESTRL